jgi:hypothetical protein
MAEDEPETVRFPLTALKTLVPEADLALLPACMALPDIGVFGTPPPPNLTPPPRTPTFPPSYPCTFAAVAGLFVLSVPGEEELTDVGAPVAATEEGER